MADLRVKLATAPAELDGAYALRHRVFVVEQGVPVELERDEHDAAADHAVALDGGRVVATGRLVALDARAGKVGRMAVDAGRRGEGLGAAVLAELEGAARRRGLAEVVLHAQLSARGFYDRLGYRAEGPVFEEAGIAHVEMRKRLG
ncbi:GNAT family N-acetyltransferase [Anaeromyxobacter diazotrophicus]|uniref:Acetyltransferase n=1 Tax=Anaeromyxobacter diazotrophicus TaxID=2590199 RepID=A0A7I9VMC3_9BACT|nr:GNAT family N-acetyltransferase [Anaeromyxobacter diazotrophicus]GEJ57552.1 acetyltransferase [Anaeromyxobacter diazotrophicus]